MGIENSISVKWLEEHKYIADPEIKDVWEKEYPTGLIIKVSYNVDEGLFYARPIGPTSIDDALNLLYFETIAFTAELAVHECFSRYRNILRSAYALAVDVEIEE